MQNKKHLMALLEALFVTLLWSSSFVFIKRGLDSIGALTFAGLRYVIAAMLLIGYLAITRKLHEIKQITRNQWFQLIGLGLMMYFVTQGAQYLGLFYLPAIQVSLMLNLTPVLILMFSSRILGEKPTKNNLLGVGVFLFGAAIYFFPLDSSLGSPIGYVVMTVCLLFNAFSTMLGRSINQSQHVSPVVVTTVSMTMGGLVLLGSGLAFEGIPSIGIEMWGVILLLASVNTAFAFTLWNKTMQVLTSIESSIVNNTMLVQIAILSFLFMEEPFTFKSVIAVVIVSIGVFLVQYQSKRQMKSLKNARE